VLAGTAKGIYELTRAQSAGQTNSATIINNGPSIDRTIQSGSTSSEHLSSEEQLGLYETDSRLQPRLFWPFGNCSGFRAPEYLNRRLAEAGKHGASFPIPLPVTDRWLE
jgi:hypothetical protein